MNGILQIKKGRPNYYIVLDYVDADGKRKRPWIATDIPVAGNHKRQANDRLKETIAEYESKQKQNIDFSKDILFSDFITQWLDTLYKLEKIAPTTYDGYKINLDTNIIPYFKDIKVKDLTPAHMQKYVNDRMENVSGNTVIKYLHNIKKCLDSAIKQKIILVNPASQLQIDWPEKIRYNGAKHLNEKQIVQLLTAVKGDLLEPIILFAMFYGMRRSEIIGLKWENIDLENNVFTVKHTVIRVNKTLHKNDRTKNNASNSPMPIPNIIANALKRIKEQQALQKLLQPNDYINEGYVFTHADGKLIHPNYVSKRFTKILQRNNLPHIRFHDTRHSAAGYMKYLGFDMKDIQTWLRHGDIGTTMNIYVNLDMDAKRNIADSLNQRFESFGN